MEITFANPSYLWFLVAIPLMILAHFVSLRFTRRKALKFANFPAIEYVTGERILSKNYTILAIRLVTLLLLILAVSGAVFWYEGETANMDFVLAIDASGSMMATDFEPTRMEAAKNSALLFIDSVPGQTEIGVLSFAGVAFVKQTPTYDLSKVRGAIKNISTEIVGGTAIGSAIISSVTILTNPGRAKVIILLTDGQSNVGPSVREAINYANENHVTIYTIGVGTASGGGFPEMNISFVSRLDPATLKNISDETKGKYYEATNESELSGAYKEIAKSSTQKIPVNVSLIFLVTALILLFVEWGLINTKYRTLP
jgi:Ca-activated chloride channel family protein